MSLFPAYSAGTSEEKVTTTVTDEVKEQGTVIIVNNNTIHSNVSVETAKIQI